MKADAAKGREKQEDGWRRGAKRIHKQKEMITDDDGRVDTAARSKERENGHHESIIYPSGSTASRQQQTHTHTHTHLAHIRNQTAVKEKVPFIAAYNPSQFPHKPLALTFDLRS